ncbi:titin homolog isoform X8 [Biomphalaria glabrata]|uniref:Titin homolog isoform X8 n=1 Tax=Biomphalaria glabrata TaxID=6526 RepID=A0A9W2Z4V1_BIOGL|nr:titin homolog isoform X8 [Biomphalaria glabrata]
MTGGALNLSLLSRGVGEVHSNGHEKVDVFLEPEDYYNFTTHPDRVYLPPVQTHFDNDVDSGQYSTRSLKDLQSYRVPKTFTTRKGALLLFSEDLAQRNMERASKRKYHSKHHDHETSTDDSQKTLRTVEDLTKSILKYGAEDAINNKVYLKFVHTHRDNFERQIRPGFSAKRYLATWTRTWDDSVFDNIIKHGYITERSLYKANISAPNLRRRLLYEDLSHMPQPYRLMKSMLLTPSSLSGYTFYRVPTDVSSLEDVVEEQGADVGQRAGSVSNIRVIRTADNIQEVVDYNSLDRESKTNVITDLLVKSAVHYALRKQEELYEKSLMRAMNGDEHLDDGKTEAFEFNMKEAVESLLDSQNGHFSLHSSLPEVDDRNNNFDMGVFRKVESIQDTAFKKQAFPSSRLSGSDVTDSDFPSISARTDSTSSEFSGVPVLPPIRHNLSPIRDVSRETTSQVVVLPPINKGAGGSLDLPTVNIQPATPQHSSLTLLSHQEDKPDDVEAEYLAKASDAKTNKKSLKKDAGGQVESLKGSVVMAPDGKIVSVGGSVVRGGVHKEDVGNMNDVLLSNRNEDEFITSEDEPDPWKLDKRLSLSSSMQSPSYRPRGSLASSSVSKEDLRRLSSTGRLLLWDQTSRISGDSTSHISSVSISEKDIMDTLSDHAHRIANNVLSHSGAGSDLEVDVKEAVDEIMKSSRSSSMTSSTSAAEFKSSSTKSITTAAARAAGVDPPLLTAEHQISPEVLEALSAHSLTPEQIEMATDSEGKLNVKVDLDQAMGGVQHGRLHVAPGSGVEDGRRQVSIPAGKGSHLEDSNLDVISYQVPDSGGEDNQINNLASKVKADAEAVDDDSTEGLAHSEDVQKDLLNKADLDSAALAVNEELDQSAATSKKEVAFDKPEQTSSQTTSQMSKTPDKKTAQSSKITKGITAITSQKSDVNAEGKPRKEKKTPDQKEEPFVVGGVDHKNEISLLYGGEMPTPGGTPPHLVPPKAKVVPTSTKAASQKTKGKPKEKKPKKEPALKKEAAAKKEKPKKAKKGKKGKKKEEPPQEEPVPEEPAPVEVKPPSPVPPPEPAEPAEEDEFIIHSSSEAESEEEDFEFNIVREVTSPPLPPETSAGPKSVGKGPSPGPDEDESEEEDVTAVSNLKSISNKEARAAKQAAAAAKRREEVERRRREKEEQIRKAKEDAERQIALKKEMEEVTRRKEEERRLRKLEEQEAEERERREQEEAERRKKIEAEKEKRMKEEYMRKKEEVRRKELEEEMRRYEMLLERQKEEERLRMEEELKMSKMAEEERLEYERKKREIEERERQQKLEEELRLAEEKRRLEEEIKLLAAEKAREQALIAAKLRFERLCKEESVNLDQAHKVNRAFVFSYFELLQWLGLDVPDFELAKLADY